MILITDRFLIYGHDENDDPEIHRGVGANDALLAERPGGVWIDGGWNNALGTSKCLHRSRSLLLSPARRTDRASLVCGGDFPGDAMWNTTSLLRPTEARKSLEYSR